MLGAPYFANLPPTVHSSRGIPIDKHPPTHPQYELRPTNEYNHALIPLANQSAIHDYAHLMQHRGAVLGNEHPSEIPATLSPMSLQMYNATSNFSCNGNNLISYWGAQQGENHTELNIESMPEANKTGEAVTLMKADTPSGEQQRGSSISQSKQPYKANSSPNYQRQKRIDQYLVPMPRFPKQRYTQCRIQSYLIPQKVNIDSYLPDANCIGANDSSYLMLDTAGDFSPSLSYLQNPMQAYPTPIADLMHWRLLIGSVTMIEKRIAVWI